jgi:hypothetical protein
MDLSQEIINTQVAAEDVIRHLEQAASSALKGAQSGNRELRKLSPELRRLKIALTRLYVRLDCEKSLLLLKIGMPMQTKFTSLPKTRVG